MIALASGLRVYLACGATDMREGIMTGSGMLVHQTPAEVPFGGAVFTFRGRVLERVVDGHTKAHVSHARPP